MKIKVRHPTKKIIASYYGASYIIYGNTKNRMSDALDSLEDIMLSLKKADIILPKRQ